MKVTPLRGGGSTADPRLDALPDKDPGNRDYPAMALLAAPALPPLRSRIWRGPGVVTDQGREGACVGHGILGCALSQPSWAARQEPALLDDPSGVAYQAYHRVQHLDDWDGCSLGPKCPITPSPEAYDGTSLKAGGKWLVEQGFASEYRWAFGLDEMVEVLGRKTPVIIAVAWTESMYDAFGGQVVVKGKEVGRHCLQVPRMNYRGRWFEWQNSWGLDYGIRGRARLSFDAMRELLEARRGEVMVPTWL